MFYMSHGVRSGNLGGHEGKAEQIVNGPVYLDMLEQWLMPQLWEHSQGFIYQQDGAPPHFHHEAP